MGSLIKWETRQTLTSKSFWIIGIALLIIPALLLIATLRGSDVTGYDAYLEGLSNYNSFLMFLTGVFAGIHVTGAFETRKIQAAVMAGNSRIKILIAKFISYSASIAVFSFISIIASSVIAFVMQGTGGIDGSFAKMIVARACVYVLIETAYASICFLTAMFIRNQGGAIGFNLMLMVILNIVVQMLMAYPWAEKILRFIPAGQTIFLLGDFSGKNILMAISSAVIAFLAVPLLSNVKFSKEELK